MGRILHDLEIDGFIIPGPVLQNLAYWLQLGAEVIVKRDGNGKLITQIYRQ